MEEGVCLHYRRQCRDARLFWRDHLRCVRFIPICHRKPALLDHGSRRDARENGSLLSNRPIPSRVLSDSNLDPTLYQDVGNRLGLIAWDRVRFEAINGEAINGRIGLLVPEVRFARRAIKVPRWQFTRIAIVQCECSDCLQT